MSLVTMTSKLGCSRGLFSMVKLHCNQLLLEFKPIIWLRYIMAAFNGPIRGQKMRPEGPKLAFPLPVWNDIQLNKNAAISIPNYSMKTFHILCCYDSQGSLWIGALYTHPHTHIKLSFSLTIGYIYLYSSVWWQLYGT